MTPGELLQLMFKCSNTTTNIDPACPALAPPAGELPFDPNASSLWSTSLGILTACCVLIALSMALRVFTRMYIIKRFFTLEDALMIFATILFAPIVGLQLKAYQFGGSKHQWNVTVGDLLIALRYVYAVQIMYCLSLYAAKLSILLQIKHIFEGTQQRKTFIFWASWTLIVLVTCAYTATLMVLLFSCNPVRKAWNPLLPGRCHNSAAGYISGTINLISDIAVLLLPVVGAVQLQMDKRKKAAVSAVFATGFMCVFRCLSIAKAHANSACGASVLRLYYSSQEAKSNDKTYWLALVGLWGAVEIAMVILCGCFISFPRFLKWVRETTASQVYGSQRYKSRDYGSESQSRLRSDAPIELGIIGVTNEIRVVSEDWRALR
ncbi:hypothetical protein C7974DRAFT_207391 [Boeremia exigua]|uniref:uncharacterized protein n=1 Tax=Boeremia exigua TaxID=749465 RepID=UPI001E8E783C|nr:uncharacterized protein C7974DRAFT_207391 [Boeremia exigua]KAH6625789.1 hypothetical protein C7974DRAFT_207391 [Boeremia exigua]